MDKQTQDATNKAFPLEKILTISATEYTNFTGKSALDFALVGVHVERTDPHKLIETFAEAVPEDAEVVVGFRTSDIYCTMGFNTINAYGTALVPYKTRRVAAAPSNY